MLRFLYLLIASLALPQYLLAESFQDFLSTQQHQTQKEFKKFSNQEKDEFALYKKQLQAAFKLYKKQVSHVWGKQHADIPGKTRDVSYQKKLKQRSVIDYKKGKVTVELALNPKQAAQPQLVKKKLKNALKATLNQGVDTRSIIEIAKSPDVSTSRGKPVLAGLIATRDGSPLAKTDQTEFINQQINKITSSKTRGADNKPRVIVSTTLPMIPDHIRVRAMRYKKPVYKYADNMKIPTEIVYAIIETESMFNPNARSSVPAFGLMQLVPTSGARDAYRWLFKKDKVVSDRYLYNPDNNIKLGSAFFHKLYYVYFKRINNPQSRTWAAIAAYNTGAGNVFNTFAGKYRRSKFGNRSNWKKKALSLINNKTPEQVYQYLKRNLPHKETRHYIQNIRKRMPKYKTL